MIYMCHANLVQECVETALWGAWEYARLTPAIIWSFNQELHLHGAVSSYGLLVS